MAGTLFVAAALIWRQPSFYSGTGAFFGYGITCLIKARANPQ